MFMLTCVQRMFPDAIQQTEEFWLPEVPGREGALPWLVWRRADERVGRRQEEGGVGPGSSPLGQTVLRYPVSVVLSPVVGLHLGLQVAGVLREDGQSEVVRAEPGQDRQDQVWPPVRHQPVPGLMKYFLHKTNFSNIFRAAYQDVLRLVAAEGVAELLRHGDGLLPLLHLELLLRQDGQLLVVALAGQVLLQHVDVLEDILKVDI